MSKDLSNRGSKYNIPIWILSIVIPLTVAALFSVRIPGVERMGFLPPIYAVINALTAVLLAIAVFQIKKGNKAAHELLMKTCLILSVIFLLLYVTYHMTSDSTPYGGVGFIRGVYFFILISHILLSIVIIPFVLITYVRAISGQFLMHKKIARITFPLWLYVAITGVIVYIMMSPYY